MFSPKVFELTIADTLKEELNLPRIEYAQALLQYVQFKRMNMSDQSKPEKRPNLSILEQRILQCLEDKEDGLSTLIISKEVIGPNGRKTDINPTLYSMEKKGLLIRVQNGNLISWRHQTFQK